MLEQSHAKRNRFFDVANGVDEAKCVRVGEIEEMLVENFVGAIADKEIS